LGIQEDKEEEKIFSVEIKMRYIYKYATILSETETSCNRIFLPKILFTLRRQEKGI